MDCSCRRLGLRLAALAAALLLLSAQALAQGAPVRGGNLNVGIDGDWPTLDPLGMGAQNERHVGRSVYDTLFEFDEKGGLIPSLAESYTVSADAMSFKLKTTASASKGVPSWNLTPERNFSL